MSWSGCANLHHPRVTSPLAHNVITASDPSSYFADPGSPCDSAAASAASSPSPPPSPGLQLPRLTTTIKRPRKALNGVALPEVEEAEVEEARASPEIASQGSPREGEDGPLSPRDHKYAVLQPAAPPSTNTPSTAPLASLALAAVSEQATSQPLQSNLDPQLFLSNFRSYETTSPTLPGSKPSDNGNNDATSPDLSSDNERLSDPTTTTSLSEHHASLTSPQSLKRKASELEGHEDEEVVATTELEEGEIRGAEDDNSGAEYEDEYDGEGEDQYEPLASFSPKRHKSRRAVEDSAQWRRIVAENMRISTLDTLLAL
ncbi:hypothetical protein LTR78_003946 [Recurvomyces mirabilis]|uniref:Uncharacterized protein n=1 Tax=Recurvomyces mirabilis TaxID=574656 RepID=A0AAE1C305_9PEZI|nr:hypothetical protein LTR78_003946 [Recurvomyces mirabilis]